MAFFDSHDLPEGRCYSPGHRKFILADILIPNQTEAEILTGLPVHGRGGTIILTLGSRGALLLDGRQSLPVAAFPITPVDTTAAGDAFVGGLAVALAEGRPLPDAVRWGNAAGALAATALGAQPSLPTRSALLDLLND